MPGQKICWIWACHALDIRKHFPAWNKKDNFTDRFSLVVPCELNLLLRAAWLWLCLSGYQVVFVLGFFPPNFCTVEWTGCSNTAAKVTRGTVLWCFWLSLCYLRVCFLQFGDRLVCYTHQFGMSWDKCLTQSPGTDSPKIFLQRWLYHLETKNTESLQCSFFLCTWIKAWVAEQTLLRLVISHPGLVLRAR